MKYISHHYMNKQAEYPLVLMLTGVNITAFAYSFRFFIKYLLDKREKYFAGLIPARIILSFRALFQWFWNYFGSAKFETSKFP